MPETETNTCEAQQLRRCIRDVVALSALPAVWIGYDPRRIAESLADVLLSMLHLDLIYIVVREEADGIPAEVAHNAQGPVPEDRAREIGRALAPWLGPDSRTSASVPDPLGGGTLRIALTPFEIGARSGVLVAGSRQAGFPTEVDRLLLGVGANQAAILFERRRAEEQLQESQRQLTDFVESATEGLQWVGPDGIILWANKAEMDLLGYPREQYIGRPIAEFHADRPVIEDILRRLANGERLHGCEARLRCKDGSLKHVLINSDVLWEDGKFIHTRCFTRDITERKRAEEALRESEERLRLALEAGGMGIWDWNLRANMVSWDLPSSVPQDPDLDPSGEPLEATQYLLHPEDREHVAQAVARVMAQGTDLDLEFRLVLPDGDVRWRENRGKLFYDETGTPTRMLGVVMDITERKRAEEAVLRLASIVEYSDDAIVSKTLDGIILSWNRGAERIYGYSAAEVIGRPISILVPPDRLDEVSYLLTRLRRGECIEQYETVRMRKDGERINISLTDSPIKDAVGKIVGVSMIARDITARKRAEEALRESEERLRLAMESGRMGTWDWNLLTDEVTMSRRLEEIYGLAPGTFGGTLEAAFASIHPEDREAVAQMASRVIERGTESPFDYRVVWPDGSIRWLEGRGNPVHDETGRAIRMLGVCVDITERKRAEEALRESEERFRCLSACSPVGIYQTDLEGHTIYNNPRSQAIGGFTNEEALGEGWARFVHPVDRERVIGEWAESARAGREFSVEFRVQSPQGIDRWVHSRAAPMFSIEGRLIGHVGTVEDITEGKRAEEALRQERDFAESLIETAQAIVLVLDTEGRIVRFNPYMEQIAGYRPDEVRGEDWSATFVPAHDRPRAREAFVRTLAGGENSRSIHAISTKHGDGREIEWCSKALKDGDGTMVGVLAIGHDLTELRDAQRRALQAERLAAIGEMVAGLAHESRNALHRGQVCLEMLALEVEDRPEAVRLIDRLQKAQDDLYALYEDVRSYAAPIHLARRACDLAEIWRAAWAQLEHLRQGRAATLREEGDRPDLHCAVDPFRLEQVFRNILENCLAACPDPVAIAIRCTPAEIDGQRALRIAVRDRGPGLGPEQKRRLFEPFFTTKTKGTGLGMAIARRIVEAHRGRIAVGEGGGPGTEIILTLPRGHP